MMKAAEEYKFAIVMKFLRVRPPIDVIRLNVVKKWSLIETPMISFMDDFHVLIQMKNERDFIQGHTAVVCRVEERHKEVGKPKKNITWQPKKLDIKGTSSGTKDDKEMEANIASRGERLQVTREDKNSNVVRLRSLEAAPNSINAGMISNIGGESAETNQSRQVQSFLLNTEMPKDLENEKDVSEEECDGVWCDKENEEALEFMQLKVKESSELPKNRVDEMEIVLA
ncbi:hypothetical protein ACLOJK_017444 [Asimina triloba]